MKIKLYMRYHPTGHDVQVGAALPGETEGDIPDAHWSIDLQAACFWAGTRYRDQAYQARAGKETP